MLQLSAPDAKADDTRKPFQMRPEKGLRLFGDALKEGRALCSQSAAQRHFDTYSKGVVSKAYGYGNPLYVNTACYEELGSSANCTGTTKGIVQGTVGAWYRFLRGPYGTMQVGAQYSYTRRFTFEGIGGAPQTDENIVMMSFRYYPFQ